MSSSPTPSTSPQPTTTTDSQTVTLTIKSPQTNLPSDISFSLPLNASILSIKKRIAETHSVHPPAETQKLIYRGRILEDGKRLDEVLGVKGLETPLEETSFTFHLVYSPSAARPAPEKSQAEVKDKKEVEEGGNVRSSSSTAAFPPRLIDPVPSGPWPGEAFSTSSVELRRTDTGAVQLTTATGEKFETNNGRRYDGGYLLLGPNGEVAVAYPKDIHSSIRPYDATSNTPPRSVLLDSLIQNLRAGTQAAPAVAPVPAAAAAAAQPIRNIRRIQFEFRASLAHVYLAIKLIVLLYFLIDPRDYRRSAGIVTAAILIFMGQTGMLEAVRGWMGAWWPQLGGIPRVPGPEVRAPAAAVPAAPAAGVQGEGNAPAAGGDGAADTTNAEATAVPEGQQAEGPAANATGADTAGAAVAEGTGEVGTPGDLANRLLADQHERQTRGIRAVYRNFERVVQGLFMSLVPDAAEIRDVMVPDEPMEAGLQG